MTFADLIGRASARLETAGVSSARLDAEVLLGFVAGIGRAGLFGRFREEVPESVGDRFEELLRRRVEREPVAYLVGEKEFYSLGFDVTRDVLIPRPETELLVEETLKCAPRGGTILDVGTGSGCVAVAIAVNRPDLAVIACDVAPAALGVAKGNARRHRVEGRVRFAESDLFSGLEAGERFDVIVSNPPYVADSEDLEAELDWEPAGALRAGSDGMALIDRLLPESRRRLNRGGTTIVEIGSDQAALVRRAAKNAGFSTVDIVRDLADLPRVVRAS